MGGSVLTDVLEKSGRRCGICYGLHGDSTCKRGQIAHLDHNHQNNKVDNLAFLCLEHHDEYDTRYSQSKSWTIQEVKRYRDSLYEEIAKLRNTAKRQIRATSSYQVPIYSTIFYTSVRLYELDAIDNNTGKKYNEVFAHSLLYDLSPTFEITNPNHLDIRIVRFYVDIIKYISIDILEIRESKRESGGGMRIREFGCEVASSVGTYECSSTSDDFDYLRLSSGEMEVVRINVDFLTEGIYRLRVGFDYSIGGSVKNVELEDSIQEIAVFDPIFHKPVWRSLQ